MKDSECSETQIVSILKQGDAGIPVKDLCRQIGIITDVLGRVRRGNSNVQYC